MILKGKTDKLNNLIEKIEEYILSGCTHNENRAIGVEIESIIYNKRGERIPVYSKDEFSASDFLHMIDSECKDHHSFVTCSLEPGGQVEWASRPAFTIHDLNDELNVIKKAVESVSSEMKLTVVDLGLDPVYSPNDIKLINQKKYQLMHKRFTSSGHYGSWMMRNTASIQVNIDLLDKQDAEECGFIAECISPFAAMLFSNAPFMENKPVGFENIRYQIWEDTDPSRCGHFIDHGMSSMSGLLTQFAGYILEVPVIFTTPDKQNEVGYFDGTIKEWMNGLNERNELTNEDIKVALHQIFTHNRFKNVLEIRTADRSPHGYELASAAFWIGLMEKGKVRESLLESLRNWTDEERIEMNQRAATFDLNQGGPMGKSISHWLEWFAELAYEGLDVRANRLNIKTEKTYIEPLIDNVFSNGVFSLQVQNKFSKQNLSVRDFILSKAHQY